MINRPGWGGDYQGMQMGGYGQQEPPPSPEEEERGIYIFLFI